MTRKKHKGLAGWDYTTRSIYMITLATSPSRPVFGVCREWGMERSAVAKAVYDAWMAIPGRFPAVRLMVYTIMPDHFHGLLFVTEAGVCDLDDVVCSFAEDAEARAGRSLWEDDYNDVICLAKGQRRRMTAYIMANPGRLWIKQQNPALFRRVLGFRHPRLFALGASDGERELWDAETGQEIAKPRKADGRLLLVSPFAPRRAGAVVREARGKPHFEWLNAAARSIADFAIGWARK